MKIKIRKYQTILILAFAFLNVFQSCNSDFPNYESTDSGLYFLYHKIGEKNSNANLKDYVTVDISYKTIEDSVFFNAKRRFQILKAAYPASIDECFTMLSVGDSATFILSADLFFEYTLERSLPSFIDSLSFFKVDIEMLEIISEERFIKEKEEFLGWIEDFSIYEKIRLSNFLTDCTNDYQTEKQGLYKSIQTEGTGLSVQKGDTLVLDYEGRFLNGKIFDSTKKRNRTFEYIYGTEWQVIRGMELAVSQMKDGEKSIFILPSELAFGETGNSNGAIPPFSTLIYEIELLEVRK